MKRKATKLLGLILAVLMTTGVFSFAVTAGSTPITVKTEDYVFEKISNPTAGSGEADGINTNDVTGFDANRLNSYAWAVTSRGNCIYIGTNRTLFGSALNAVGEKLQAQNEKMTPEFLGKVINLISGTEVPVNLEEEDYIPQIIKFDIEKGSTEVIYQPRTAVGEDGRLYYTDKNGVIIPEADVSSETASFRSVVEFEGNLYFGSLGTDMLQLVRVDKDDNAEVVFQTIGLTSSLRACCVHDDGDGETVYFGGQDTTNREWMIYRQNHPGVLPIFIRYLDPKTAGTDHEDWSGIIADYKDFGKYAYATVYASGGGNVWDLCDYNGKIYLILAYDGGWAMFRGEKGGDNPNGYGWTWTEIVGDDSIYNYPLAMNGDIAGLNEEYRVKYGAAEYSPSLKGAGLLESTATPYVYNGKMYIGSFDNATTIQSETVIKLITKLMYVSNSEIESNGPSLTQIFAPIYQLLSHPQHVWVMDENENIAAVESANELLEGTRNDYVWRFQEYHGKLYTGTFDSSTAFNYFLDFPVSRLIKLLESKGVKIPERLQSVMDGSITEELTELFKYYNEDSGTEKAGIFKKAALRAIEVLQAFVNDELTVETLYGSMKDLITARDALRGEKTENVVTGSGMRKVSAAPSEAVEIVDSILCNIDIEGLKYWKDARELVRNTESGFDIFVTEDGENWNRIVGNGIADPFNYGARTFTVCNDELFVGTANPYYGAQLWKITDESDHTNCPSKIFTDFDPDAWYHEAVDYVVANGIMNGTGNNKFEPNGITTRAMLVTILYRYEGSPAVTATSKFSDVPAGKWFTDPVIWASENGIVSGYGNGKFGPNDKLTREQCARILFAYAVYKGRNTSARTDITSYTDASTVSSWAREAVEWAIAEGIIKGMTETTIVPRGSATRAQAATILMRYSQSA